MYLLKMMSMNALMYVPTLTLMISRSNLSKVYMSSYDTAVDRDASNHPPHPDDVVQWPDGTECSREDLPEYLTFMSDDYVIL